MEIGNEFASFSELNINEEILRGISEMGFETPTTVQEKVIPHILNGEDLIVISKTGSGKTAAFGIPMLQITEPTASAPQGLILTPTRELAVQVDNDLALISKHLAHRTAVVYGQHNIRTEIAELKRNPAILTGTPGRVFDHIQQGNFSTKQIRFLVLDEADRMLDMGFIDQVVKIIKTLPRDRVTLLFSATIPPEIQHICRKYMRDPETVEISSDTLTVDAITQLYYRVERNEKRTQLGRLLLIEQPESCMIFCNTRIAVDRVQDYLEQKGYSSQALHGDIPQAQRMKTIQGFKSGTFHILVATDVASRGLHVDDLSLVINFDVPNEKSNYVHRIGRTGRAGNGGRAVTLVSGDDIMSLYEIEEYTGAMIEEADLPSESVYLARKADSAEWALANQLPEGHRPAARPRNGGHSDGGTGGRRAGGRATSGGGRSGNRSVGTTGSKSGIGDRASDANRTKTERHEPKGQEPGPKKVDRGPLRKPLRTYSVKPDNH
ncbi:MAG: DEAD/DEAH box helicase [Bacillota bacterium]